MLPKCCRRSIRCASDASDASASWRLTQPPKLPDMTALSLETAKTVGIVVAIALFVLAIASAYVIKKVTTKAISVVVFAILGIGVWTQRSELQDCAKRTKDRINVGDTSQITCRFFGSDVKIGPSD